MTRILIIEDDAGIRANVLDLLDAEGYEGVGAADGEEGVRLAEGGGFDVVVCDIKLPKLDGFGVLEAIRAHPELAATPFLFLTARADRSDVRAGMTSGADDYLTKPFTRVELLEAIRTRLVRCEQLAQSTQDGGRVSRPPSEWATAVLRSPRMVTLYEDAAQAARAPISVLLLGETGVGKEVLAREIHAQSPRREAPFVPLNCAALSPALLEAELFGHEKGSFTGAAGARPGLLETAQGGTLFLDEIGELDTNIQAKLLRVLEDKRVMRVGGREERAVDVRFISATNRDLEEDVAGGRFRRDLYFRINAISLEIPPLRERVEEIAPLAERFVVAACRALDRSPHALSEDVLEALERYRWPGNVRELKNAIEGAVALCRGTSLRPADLPRAVTGGAPSEPPPRDLRAAVEEAERERILDALDECGGNQTRAAELLGISRRTLISRLDAYELPRPRKKS